MVIQAIRTTMNLPPPFSRCLNSLIQRADFKFRLEVASRTSVWVQLSPRVDVEYDGYDESEDMSRSRQLRQCSVSEWSSGDRQGSIFDNDESARFDEFSRYMSRICLLGYSLAIKVAQFSLAAGLAASITTAQSEPVYTSIKSIDAACKRTERSISAVLMRTPFQMKSTNARMRQKILTTMCFDGCPDRDNDGDHVPDSVDDCPTSLKPNGVDDLDGCPDWN